MNQYELVKKIKLLKNIQPHETVLDNIKKDIYRQVKTENKDFTKIGIREFFANVFVLLKSNPFVATGVSFTIILMIFLSVSTGVLPNQLHKAILYTRLGAASNQYEKAIIAMADTTNTYGKSEIIDKYRARDFSQSLLLANNELSNLKLRGENGKYTARQCHELYQEYLSYLKKKYSSIPLNTDQSFLTLKSQIITYEEQSEKKLHMYSNL